MQDNTAQPKRRIRGHNEGSIRQRADGIYEARITCGVDLKTGKLIRKSLYHKDKKVLKSRMDKALNELKTNGCLSQAKTYTVIEWLEHWLKTYKMPDATSSTINNLQNIINKYLAPIHKMKLDKLRSVEVQQIYNSIDTSSSTRMVEATHSCLNNAYKYAIKLGYVNYNPAQATFLPKKKTKAVKAMDKEQQDAFLKVLETSPNKNMLLMYLLTGMRRGELVALQWKDINLDKGVINITGAAVRQKDYSTGSISQVKSKTKTAAGIRAIPISDTLNKILTELKGTASGGYLFPGSANGMVSIDAPDRDFKEVAQRAGLKDFTLHSLRHTFATRVYESGVKDKVNQALLGHASDAVTRQIYIHANADFIKEEAKKINIISEDN